MPFELIQEWLRAPYPTAIVPIQDERLRNEVFRRTVGDRPVDPTLPASYHHTGLEHRGDALAAFLVAEVCANFFAQGESGYKTIARRLHVNGNKAKNSLVSNKHWTLLSQQFDIGAYDTKIKSLSDDRLADNLEAYLYALFLDQGIEVTARWFFPIILKKLYAEAASFELKLPARIYGPIEADEPIAAVESGILGRLKSVLFGPSSSASAKRRRRPPPRKVTYDGFTLPHWQVACSDGADCRRNGCYFQHPNKDGDWDWDQPGSFPDLFAELQKPMSTEERRSTYRQKIEQLIDDKLAIERLHMRKDVMSTEWSQMKKDVMSSVEDYTISAVDRIVDPWIAKVKKAEGVAEAAHKRSSETYGQVKAMEKTVATLNKTAGTVTLSDKGLATVIERAENNTAGKVADLLVTINSLQSRVKQLEDNTSASQSSFAKVLSDAESPQGVYQVPPPKSSIDRELVGKRLDTLASTLKTRSKDFNSQLLREAHRTSDLEEALRALQQRLEMLEGRGVKVEVPHAMQGDSPTEVMEGAEEAHAKDDITNIPEQTLSEMLSSMSSENQETKLSSDVPESGQSGQVVGQSVSDVVADEKQPSDIDLVAESDDEPVEKPKKVDGAAKQGSGRKKPAQAKKTIRPSAKAIRKAEIAAAQTAAKARKKAEKAVAHAALLAEHQAAEKKAKK